jgi:hypothetical protein
MVTTCQYEKSPKESNKTDRRDQILLLVYCGDVCAICLLADDLRVRDDQYTRSRATDLTHGNAVWVLLSNALCLSLALLFVTGKIHIRYMTWIMAGNSPKGCSSLNLERMIF